MSKIIVPCDVWCKRMYRMYVETTEGATEEEIERKAVEMLTDGRDIDTELQLERDFEFEEQDICFVQPDIEGSWTEEEEEDFAEVMSRLQNRNDLDEEQSTQEIVQRG